MNQLLVKEFFKEDYDALMEQARNMDNPEELHKKMNQINTELLSLYLFEHKLKGIKEHIPTFRVSPSLFLSSGEAFTKFKLLLSSKYQEILSTLEA